MAKCPFSIIPCGSILLGACMHSCSVMSGSVIPRTVALLVPLPMGFFRQEYWSGCHFLLQGIFPIQRSNPGLLCLLHWQVDSLPLHHLGSPKSRYFLVLLHFADIHALGGIYTNPISMIEIHLINSTGYLLPPWSSVMSPWSPQMAMIGIFTPQKCVNYCFVLFFLNLRKWW